MSTIEKLFVQIFERKNSIIEQVKHQTDLYDQHLASKLLIEGITPPSWLWNPGSLTQSSDPKELQKEELISELLLPRSQPVIPYTSGQCSVYSKTFVAASNAEISDGFFTEPCSSNKGFNAGNGLASVSQSHVNDVECALNGVPELDSNATSPKYQAYASTIDMRHEPELSLVRIQRSKSRQKALEIRNSAKTGAHSCLRDEKNTVFHYSGSAAKMISSLQSDHVNEMELVKPPDVTNDCCGVKEAEVADCQSKEECCTFYSGRATRSRGSCQQPSWASNFSYIAEKDGDKLAESIGKHMQHPNLDNELLEVVNITNEICRVREAKTGDCLSKKEGSNGHCGRITRSRSSCQQFNYVNESSKLDSSSDVPHVDQSVCKSMQQSQPLSQVGGNTDFQNSLGNQMSVGKSSPSQKDLELLAANTREHQGKEIVADEYVGRLTMSRTTHLSEVFNSNISGCKSTLSSFAASNKSQGAQCTQTFAVRSSPSKQDLELCKANTVEHPSKGTFVDEGMSKPVNSSNVLGRRITRSRSAASNNSLLAKSLNSIEGFDIQKASGTQISVQPSTDSNAIVNQQQCGASTTETEVVPERPVEAPLCSGSKLDVANLRVGLEVLVSRPSSDSIMFVKPKQLDFDDVGVYSTNETFSPSVEENRGERSLEKEPSILLDPVESQNKVTFVNHQEKHDSSLQKPLLEELEVLSKEEEAQRISFEALPKERAEDETDNVGCDSSLASSASGTSNLEAVSSVKETSDVYKDAVALPLLEHTSSLEEQKVLSKEEDAQKISFEFHPKEGNEVETDNIGCVSSLASSASRTSNLEAVSSVKETSDIYKDAVALPLLDQTSSLIDHSTTMKVAGKDSLGSPPKKAVESYLFNVDADASMDFSFEKCASSAMEGSWPQYKRRKIEGQLTSLLSAPPNLKGELSLEGRARSATDPFTFKPEHYRTSLVSSLTEQATGGSQGYFGEEVKGADPTTMILDARGECTVEDDQNLLHLEAQLDQENAENLTCTKRNMVEKKFHMGQDGLFSNCTMGSLHNQYLDMINTDQTMPVLEGFIVRTDDEQLHIAGGGISFHDSDLPTSTIERASVLERLCKSASMHTPSSHFSTTYKLSKTPDLYQSVPNGLLESMDLKNGLLDNDGVDKQFGVSHSCINDDVNCVFQARSYSDGLPYSSARFGWNVRSPYTSPVGKLWERTMSSSGCPKRQGSSNPELTCFPIEEDPSICEETGNADEIADTLQEGIGSSTMRNSTKREPLAEITGDCQNLPASVSAAGKFHDRCSIDSVNTEVNFTGTHNKVKKKLEKHYSGKIRSKNEAKQNQSLSMGVNGVKKAAESLHSRFSKPKLSGKSNLRKGGTSFSQRESKRNNIVSNITSFIPLVQKKQAAAVITEKRDIKVKALEAAENAKRLEVKKENERKMKKEAMKLERARLDQENLRQLEMKKKRKEEEQEKKVADMATRKRLREEEKQKEKEGKRKRIDEARRQQREHEEKLRAEKQEKETRCQAMDERVHEGKKLKDETAKYKNREDERGNLNLGRKPETEPKTPRVSTGNVSKDCEPLRDCGDIGKGCNSDKAINDDLVSKTSQEQSYEISPYQGSDDEDEEEDEISNTKFVPSWASKNSLALVVSSQQNVNPDVIFPPESFCSIAEVLLPRKQQLQ